MLRRVRRAVLGAVLALVAFASVGEAACAWVLWSGVGPSLYADSAFETLRACTDAIGERAKWLRSEIDEWWPGRTAANIKGVGHYGCFPDTIDPRGPKGGGR